jgi:hypothetical protein
MCVFVLARHWDMPWMAALLASIAFGLASPWWAASGVLYHDGLAIALILIGATIWQCRLKRRRIGAIVAPMVSGFLIAFSVVTTYSVVPIVLIIVVSLLALRPLRRDAMLFSLAFLPTISVLPIANMMAFGSPLATGYSAGAFDQNYPSPFDLANAWEKTGFYLWNSDYGLLWLFPIFLLGAAGLIVAGSIAPPVRRLLLTLMAAHFVFIISMEHHGSVGWGMGRFFMPLYPILAFGLVALSDFEGWKGHVGRALVFGALFYSGAFALAGANYGVQGVMEPGVPTLKQRLMFDHYQLYQGLFWLAMIVGVLGALLHQVLFVSRPPVSRNAAVPSRQGMPRGSKVTAAAGSRRRRRKK